MNDCLSLLKSLRRSRLLIRAARLGVQDYKRDRDLRRLLGLSVLPGPREAILRLMQEEAELEDARKAGDGRYSVTRHVEVMIALMAEALSISTETRVPDLKVV